MAAAREGFSVSKHPVLDAFLQHHNCDKMKADLALGILINLAEVRGWREVKINYCEELQMPFVTGRPSLSSDIQVALPVGMDDSLSHQQLLSLSSLLSARDKTFTSVMLAICATDSSLVYFRVTDGIVKPEPPEASEARKQEWVLKNAKRRHIVADSLQQYRQRHLLEENDDPT